MFIGLFSSSSTSRLLSSRATESSRIINGQAADVAAYPFLVSIRQFEDGFFAHCGGSVLRPNVVLTAAHCVTPPRTNPNEPFGTPSNSINNFLMPVVFRGRCTRRRPELRPGHGAGEDQGCCYVRGLERDELRGWGFRPCPTPPRGDF